MTTWSKMRLKGCQEAIAKGGGTLREIGISKSKSLEHQVTKVAKEVRAILAENDVIGVNVIQCLQKMQLRVPADVAVFGCDNLAVGAECKPGLSTIDVPAHRIGEIAGDLLRNLVSGELAFGNLHVPGKLILRRSCGCK